MSFSTSKIPFFGGGGEVKVIITLKSIGMKCRAGASQVNRMNHPTGSCLCKISEIL